MTIQVKFSCTLCGLHRVPLYVTAREEESVTEWMDQTVRAVAVAHRRRSPACQARELSELLIPTTGADKLGGPTAH